MQQACRVHQAETARRPVENWRDYGYAVDVCLNGRSVKACHPEDSDIGQPKYSDQSKDVMRLLRSTDSTRA